MHSLYNIFPAQISKQFTLYTELLLLWNKKINLVARKNISAQTIAMHILDSALLNQYIQNHSLSIADIGSGAGFPGIVLAILGYNNCFLIEKNKKKAAFLIEVISALKIQANVMNCDVRDVQNIKCDIIVSRALCDVKTLLHYTSHIIKPDTIYLLHKGQNWQEEIHALSKKWHFILNSHNNIYKENSSIIVLSNLKKKDI